MRNSNTRSCTDTFTSGFLIHSSSTSAQHSPVPYWLSHPLPIWRSSTTMHCCASISASTQRPFTRTLTAYGRWMWTRVCTSLQGASKAIAMRSLRFDSPWTHRTTLFNSSRESAAAPRRTINHRWLSKDRAICGPGGELRLPGQVPARNWETRTRRCFCGASS